MTIREQLTTTLKDEFDVAEDIADYATLGDLGLDSLAVVELLDSLSKKLNINLADDDMNKTTKIAAAVEILTARTEAPMNT